MGVRLVSFFWFSASALVIGKSRCPGSVALVGSKRGTHGEVITGIRLAEARRAEVIDSLELETVVREPVYIQGSLPTQHTLGRTHQLSAPSQGDTVFG